MKHDSSVDVVESFAEGKSQWNILPGSWSPCNSGSKYLQIRTHELSCELYVATAGANIGGCARTCPVLFAFFSAVLLRLARTGQALHSSALAALSRL